MRLEAGALLLRLHGDALELLLAPLDDEAAAQDLLVLLLHAALDRAVEARAHLGLAPLDLDGVQPAAHRLERRGEARERVAHLGRGRRVGLGGALVDGAALVVDAQREEVALDRPEDEALDLLPAEQGDGLLHVLDADDEVDALHLLQHAQPHQAAHGLVVLREARDARDAREHGGGLRGEVEGEVRRLEHTVQRDHVGPRGGEDALGLDLGEQVHARGREREGEHRGHPLGLLVLEVVLEQVEVEHRVGRRDGERRQHGARGERLHLLRAGRVLEVLGDGVQPREGVGVEEVVVRDAEDLGELRVVTDHGGGAWGALHLRDERVHVLHGAVRLLPQLHLDRRAQLREASLKVHLQRLGRRRLAVLPLGVVLGLGLDVVAQDLAQAAELDAALVLDAEGEGARGRVLVELLQLGVVAQDLEHRAERLPQKLERGRHHLRRGRVGVRGVSERLRVQRCMRCACGGYRRRREERGGSAGFAGCGAGGAVIHLALRALLGIALPADGREHE